MIKKKMKPMEGIHPNKKESAELFGKKAKSVEMNAHHFFIGNNREETSLMEETDGEAREELSKEKQEGECQKSQYIENEQKDPGDAIAIEHGVWGSGGSPI